jgi:hypothetical protein
MRKTVSEYKGRCYNRLLLVLAFSCWKTQQRPWGAEVRTEIWCYQPPESCPESSGRQDPERQTTTATGPTQSAQYKRCFQSFVNSLRPRAQILQKFAWVIAFHCCLACAHQFNLEVETARLTLVRLEGSKPVNWMHFKDRLIEVQLTHCFQWCEQKSRALSIKGFQISMLQHLAV